jgi:hypothetical protein
MGKVEIEMDLGGFRIERFRLRIKADRDDIPRINGEIGKQFLNVLQPPASLIEEPVRKQIPSTVVPQASSGDPDGGARSKSRRTRASAASGSRANPLEWQHDAGKWGMPAQKWKAGQKVLWLLYVIKNEKAIAELSAPVIAETFNAKFKQYGQLKRTSMPSILGSLKKDAPSLLMDDTTQTPNVWFLSEQGVKAAETLVQEAKTVQASSV